MSYNSPGDKPGPLRNTRNYVYNVADCIGKGATASVFLGRNRSKGDQVAIKVFENESYQITRARTRETELLKAVNHKNVMRLLANEEETETGRHVIVMPYCPGGSVYSLLEQPQNGHGFKEKEFLKFLNDTLCGLKYLKQKGIIHRDIKPGNILKGLEEDGSSVYILTDFGAARELHEEETFMSIYGTEEYIHPDMFQRAVLRQPGQNQFTSSVDLWSLGVTVYHVATGKLPFQAFGGRNDSQMMYQIITERSSGEISGIQREPAGRVERSKQLPETCYLSRGLRNLLEPILAGLFEIDPSRQLTFDQFFDAVNDVINMKTLSVFFPRQSSQITLYIRKTDSYIHLQEKLAAVTDIPSDRQLLLLGHTELKTIVEADEQIQTYPKSVQNAQFFLFEKNERETQRLPVSKLPPIPSFTVNSSLSNDSTVAKACAATVHFVAWKTEAVLKCQNLILDAKLHLRLFVEQTLFPVDRVVPEIDKALRITCSRADSIRVSKANIENIMKLMDVVNSGTNNHTEIKSLSQIFCSRDGQMEDILSKANTRTEEIKVYLSVLRQRLHEASTSCPSDQLGCHDDEHCLSKVEHIRQSIQNVSGVFSKHKKYGQLHPHEKFIHQVEKQKLEDLCVNILSLHQSHCVHNLTIAHDTVNKHLGILLKHLTRIGKVQTNIMCVIECQGQINEKLDEIDRKYQRVSDLLKANIQEVLRTPSTVSKMARLEVASGADNSCTQSEESEKSTLMKRLIAEVNQLETERSELDTLLSSNTQSLLDLKSLLQETVRLSPTSFQHDRVSVECTEPVVPFSMYSNGAQGYTFNRENGLQNGEQSSNNSGYVMSNAGCAMSNAGYATSNAGYVMSNAGYATSNAGYATSNAGCAMSNAGYAISNGGLDVTNGLNEHAPPLVKSPVYKKQISSDSIVYSKTDEHSLFKRRHSEANSGIVSMPKENSGFS